MAERVVDIDEVRSSILLPPTMKEESSFEAYKERQQWAREVANKLNVELDEGAEFFIVPVYNEKGEEIRKEFIPARPEIPLVDEKGNPTKDTISAEDAIEAARKHPGETLRAAKQKLKQRPSL